MGADDDVAAALRRIEAPTELVRWVENDEPEQPYEECTEAAWLVWLAGVRRVPPYALLGALLDEAKVDLEHLGEGTRLLEEAVEGLVSLLLDPASDTTALMELADALEAAADDPPSTFRASPGQRYAPVARALSWLARSAEGLEAGRARHEARRLDTAQHRAALLGAGTHAALPAPEAVRLDVRLIPGDPLQEALLYVFAAAAEAAALLAEARHHRQTGGVYRDAPAEHDLAGSLRERLAAAAAQEATL